jgi:hypothetical protein
MSPAFPNRGAGLFCVYGMAENTSYFIDQFLSVKPGEPFRLLPFGTLVKNGRRREITPELARRFKLPHFMPAIKLGSHEDTTRAGGHIVALEVREDGLYAVPEFNDQGAAAIANGDYRYHSPEILWEGSLENPTTGDPITGPLIVGDALLHTPHLGENAALYSIEVKKIMENEQVTMPASLLERFMGLIRPEQPEAIPTPEPLTAAVDVEQYAAVTAERDNLAAEVATMKAQAERGAKVQQFATELAGTTLADDGAFHEVLADLGEHAEGIVQKIKAITEQTRVAALTEDVGAGGQDVTGDPSAMLDAAVRQQMAKSNENYGAALMTVGRENPDLIAAYGSR